MLQSTLLRRMTIGTALIAFIVGYHPARGEAASKKPNVLLICVDDLRPQLGCYGCRDMISPNIDRLAAEGRRFTRHYVQVAACGPSRCSLLTGRRVLRSWDCWAEDRRRKQEPERPVSIAHLFRRGGYRTVCIGKVSHEPGGTMPPEYRVHQVPFSWDLALGPSGEWNNPWRAFFAYSNGRAYNAVIRWVKQEPPRLPWESADVPDEGYADGLIARAGVAQLRDLKARSGPFFLAVGFYKPHLPHNAPKKYWDLYDPEKIGLAPNPFPPKNVDPAISCYPSLELTTHYQWPPGASHIPDVQARNQRHAYFACVSYVDAQIGKVLDELKRLELDRNTAVVLWADHGWHLGEHTTFGKCTNFEIATRSPLIIKIPEIPQPGKPAEGLVESVDLYPTLAELAGLQPPTDLAGSSLVPMLNDADAPGKEGAMSCFFRGPHYAGTALRTDRYRIVEWVNTRTNQPAQVELYDHRTDPQENENIAGENPEIVKRLLRQLHATK